MASQNYSKSHMNSCVYYRRLDDGFLIYLLLYVDDILIATKNMYDIVVLKRQLSAEFDMKDLGAAKKILGMEILHDRTAEILCLSQKKFIKNVFLRRNLLRRLLHDLIYSQRNL